MNEVEYSYKCVCDTKYKIYFVYKMDTGTCTAADYNSIRSCCNSSTKVQYVCLSGDAVRGCSDIPWTGSACQTYCEAPIGSNCPIVPMRNRTFTFVNNTDMTIWLAMITGQGSSEPPGTSATIPIVFPDGTVGGYTLPAHSQVAVNNVPYNWSGRAWARTDCNTYPKGSPQCNHGNSGPAQCFFCLTGDCGSVENNWQLGCMLSGGEAPATLAEFTLYGGGFMDYYDVSYVDGANLLLTIQAVGPFTTPFFPQNGPQFACVPGQVVGNQVSPMSCPSEIQLNNSIETIGCYSICAAVSNSAVMNGTLTGTSPGNATWYNNYFAKNWGVGGIEGSANNWKKKAYLCCTCGTPNDTPALSCSQVQNIGTPGCTGGPACIGTGCIGAGCPGSQCNSMTGKECACTCPQCDRSQVCISGCSPFDTKSVCTTKVIVTQQGDNFNPNYPPSSTGILYNRVFKSAVPDAYSWQFDDSTSTYNCFNADYLLTFSDMNFAKNGGTTGMTAAPITPQPPPPNNTRYIWIWVAIILGLLLVIGIIFILVFSFSKKKKRNRQYNYEYE